MDKIVRVIIVKYHIIRFLCMEYFPTGGGETLNHSDCMCLNESQVDAYNDKCPLIYMRTCVINALIHGADDNTAFLTTLRLQSCRLVSENRREHTLFYIDNTCISSASVVWQRNSKRIVSYVRGVGFSNRIHF